MSKPDDFFPPVNICRLSDDRCKQNKNLNIIRGPTMIDTRPVSSRCQGFNLKSANNNVYVCASTLQSGGESYDHASIIGTESQIKRLGCYLNSCDNRPTFPDGLASHPQDSLSDWVSTKNVVDMDPMTMAFNESTKRKIIMGEKFKTQKHPNCK